MTTGLGIFRVEFLDLHPHISSIAWDRRFLTFVVMLPSPSNFRGVDLWGLAIMMVETLPRGSTFWSGSSPQGWWDINFQVDRLTCGKTYTAGQQFW